MEKMRMESIDMTAQNIEKIGAMFPNCITETVDENGKPKKAINFELLKQMLSSDVLEGDEAYEFTWVGKKAAIVEANTPIRKTLRPCPEESKNWGKTENLYIKGDNLESLKLLQESYLGSVKMIYIDPPYNTGKDSFVYPDDYSMDMDEYEEEIGLFDDDGNKLFKENCVANPRFHSDWLSMMYSRLMLSRNLLTYDGVVFISIDDNEYDNLKKICDEVFGASNYIETFYLQVRFSTKSLNEKDDFQKLIEQVLIYAKDKKQFVPSKPYEDYDLSKFCWKISELGPGKEMILGGKNVRLYKPGEYEIQQVEYSIDALKETWASGSILKGNTSGKFFDKQLSSRVDEDGYGCLYKVEGIGEDGIGYRYFTGPKKEGATKGKFYSGVPLVRREEIANGDCRKYSPIINYYDYSGDFGNISHEGGVTFRSGKKPVKMLKHFLEICNLKQNDIVMDFFSGSASFGHAVIDYNNEHNSNIKFILVQLEEKCPEDSDYARLGFKTICDLAIKRLSNVYDSFTQIASKADAGFRVFKLDDSNMKDVYYSPDEVEQDMLAGLESNIKEDRSDLDLLFGCLLEWGLPLSLPYTSETIEGCTVHTYNDGDLIACFNDNVPESVVKEIAKRKPLRAVFRDSSFANSPAKINVFEIFKLYMPEDAGDITKRVKVI